MGRLVTFAFDILYIGCLMALMFAPAPRKPKSDDGFCCDVVD